MTIAGLCSAFTWNRRWLCFFSKIVDCRRRWVWRLTPTSCSEAGHRRAAPSAILWPRKRYHGPPASGRSQQRRLIHNQFDGLGWKVPAMPDSVRGDDDFYSDRINQVRMPCWSRGRVTLVGDAGYCVAPLAGFGGSMAIIGAGRLANALERYPADHGAAFRHYEDGLRPFVEEVQERAATNGLAMMFPVDETELAERDRKLATGEIDMSALPPGDRTATAPGARTRRSRLPLDSGCSTLPALKSHASLARGRRRVPADHR